MNKNDNSGKEKTWKKVITILSCVAIAAIVGFAVYQHDKNTPTITATIAVPDNKMSATDEKLNDLVKTADDKTPGFLDKLDKNLNGLAEHEKAQAETIKAQRSSEPMSIKVKAENVRMTFEQADANGNVDTVLMTENLPSATPITGKIKACGFTAVLPNGEKVNFKIASVVTLTRAKCSLLREGDTTTISRTKNGGWYWVDDVDGKQE